MKHFRKHNAGFTLIELVIAIAMATLVTAAAFSVLMLGLDINRMAGDTAYQQMTVNTLLSTIGDIIAEGNVSAIETTDSGNWFIKDKNDKVLLSYFYDEVEKKGIVYVGDFSEDTATPILNDLISSSIEQNDGLFTIYVENKQGEFSTSVLCRSLQTGGEITRPSAETLQALFGILKGQLGSEGTIKNQQATLQYYSRWWTELNGETWEPEMVWTACFVSWVLSQTEVKEALSETPDNYPYWFFGPRSFGKYFKDNDRWRGAEEDYDPQPGDLIFIDSYLAIDNKTTYLGFVKKVENGVVTIIGRGSSGSVEEYTFTIGEKLADGTKIIGYGILPWK